MASLEQRAATRVKGGASVRAVAREFGRSRYWVRRACGIHELEGPVVSREQRASLRAAAAARVKGGAPVNAIADEFGRTAVWVRAACREHGVPLDGNIGHKHVARVVKTASARVAAGEAIEAVAEALGVTDHWVRSACRRHGVQVPRKAGSGRYCGVSQLAIVGALFNSALTFKDIAAKFCITRQRVQQIDAEARAHGIPLPRRKRGRRKILRAGS